VLDPGAHIFEIKGIVAIGSCRVTDRDANLADPPQSLDDQGSVAIVERLVASYEQGGRPFAVEDWPHTLCDFLGPVLGQPLGDDTQIVSLGRDENPVGVFEPALPHTIHPDNE